MNIFEVLWLAVIIAAGYFCGMLLSQHWGIAGWIIGPIAGSVSVIAGLYAIDRHVPGRETETNNDRTSSDASRQDPK